jgi:hypothetical protein
LIYNINKASNIIQNQNSPFSSEKTEGKTEKQILKKCMNNSEEKIIQNILTGDFLKSKICSLANTIKIICICNNILHLIQSGMGPL